MISTSQWQVYKNVINKVHGSLNNDTITWHRYVRSFQRYGEDTKIHEHFVDTALKCLIMYNAFRAWPMTKETSSGAIDKESIVLILNKKYIKDLGYLNSDNFFSMTPGKDKFTHRGIAYRASGETEISQAGNDPLMFYIILRREDSITGEDKY